MSQQNIVLLAFAGVFVALMVFRALGRVKPEEARTLVARGARLVDVRSPTEFASGHLPGALNIPMGELAGRIGEVGAKERPVVVYCRSGARSASAAGLLKRAGFTSVHDLGPMSRW
jgi:rhodanese-related sulfurtransferase